MDVVYYFLLHVIGMATGFAFGTLFLNTAAAIVIYFVYSFVLPGLFQLGAQLIGLVRRHPALDRLRRRPEPPHRGQRQTASSGPSWPCRASSGWCSRWPSACGACCARR